MAPTRKRSRIKRASSRRPTAGTPELLGLTSGWYWEQDAELRFVRVELRGDPAAQRDIAERILGKRRWETGVEIEGGWDAHRAVLESRQPFRDVLMWRNLADGGTAAQGPDQQNDERHREEPGESQHERQLERRVEGLLAAAPESERGAVGRCPGQTQELARERRRRHPVCRPFPRSRVGAHSAIRPRHRALAAALAWTREGESWRSRGAARADVA